MRLLFAHSVKSGLLATKFYARRLRADTFPGVAVLCYHGIRYDDVDPNDDKVKFEQLHVTASQFEAHCQLVRETCNPISIRQWREALAGRARLPDRPVLITFDDGFRTIYTLARPALRKYAVPAVVFVSTQAVIEQRVFPWAEIEQEKGQDEIRRIKALPYTEWCKLRAELSRPADPDDWNAPLSVDDVKSLAQLPLFEIGAHTHRHAVLANASLEDQRKEIVQSQEYLTKWCGFRPMAFAYPDGKPNQDYTPDTARLVKEAGFDFAFSTREGFALPGSSVYDEPRFMVLSSLGPAELAHRLSFSWR